MSASVQKLEALLARVQKNRHPRPQSAQAPVAQRPRPNSTTPLEMAMQDLGVVAPKPSSRPPKPTPAARPSVKPENAPKPASMRPTPVKPMPAIPTPARSTPVQPPSPPTPPSRQAATASSAVSPQAFQATAAAPKGPVASVKSALVTTTPATFGELLDRALALRPR